MGNQSFEKDLIKQQQTLNCYQSDKEFKIIQWRSNPTINEFIPKAFLLYENQIRQNNFLSQCQINKNLPIALRFQTFIGNLTLLKGKLNFEESLYVLKSLLTGYKVILSFFGKVAVDFKFCFITKEGEVKAWINSDFRKNTFQTSSRQNKKMVTEEQKLFLSPQEWIDRTKQTSSTANIIRTIFNIVSELTHDQQRYNNFLQKVKNFGMENLLQNYDFDKILKFTNKFIYHKKLFVKSNLLEAIQRIYDEHFKADSKKVEKCSDSRPHERLGHSEVQRHTEQSKEKMDSQCLETERITKLRKCMTGRQLSKKSRTYNCPQHVKKALFFDSTFQSNGYTKPESTIETSQMQNYKESTSSSKCSSHQETVPQFSKKSSLRRNHISPQYSYNCMTTISGNISPSMSKQISSSSLNNPKTFTIQTLTSKDGKAFSNNDYHLKIISQKKQIDNNEIHYKQTQNQQLISYNNISLEDAINEHGQGNQTPRMKKSTHGGFTCFPQQIIGSFNSISQNIQSSISFTRKNKLKPYNSNCIQEREPSNNAHLQFTSPKHISKFHKNSIHNQHSLVDFNTNTIHTIAKLISSNQNLSQRQISQGEFSQNEETPRYTGILASMGRSAKIIQIPEPPKLSFKNGKRTQTMFLIQTISPTKNSQISSNKNSYMSANIFGTN